MEHQVFRRNAAFFVSWMNLMMFSVLHGAAVSRVLPVYQIEVPETPPTKDKGVASQPPLANPCLSRVARVRHLKKRP